MQGLVLSPLCKSNLHNHSWIYKAQSLMFRMMMRCSKLIDNIYFMMSLICHIKAHHWLNDSSSVKCCLLLLSLRSMCTQDAKDTSSITATEDDFWLTEALLRTVTLRVLTTVKTCFLSYNVCCLRSTMQEQIKESRLRTDRHQKQQHVRYLLNHLLMMKNIKEARQRFINICEE